MADLSLTGDLALPPLGVSAGLQVVPEIAGALTLPPLGIQGLLSIPPTISGAFSLPPIGISASLQVVPVIEGALTLPPLSIGASVKVSLRNQLRVLYRIQRAVAPLSWRTHWAMTARDAARSLSATWALTAPARVQWEVSWDGPRKLAALSAVWSLRLGAGFTAKWSFCNVVQSLDTVWSLRGGAVFAATWACAPRVTVDLSVTWACAPRVTADMATTWACLPRQQAAMSAIWSCLARLSADISVTWGSTRGVRASHTFSWSLRGTTARNSWDATWSSGDRVPVATTWSVRWSLKGAEVTVTVPPWSLSCDGLPLQAIRLSIAQSRDSGEWRLSATLAEPETPIEPGAPVTLTIGAQTWLLVASETSAERGDTTDKTRDLRAASAITAWSAEAIARRADLSLPHGGLASAVAATISGATPLAWTLPDWRLTPIMVRSLADGSAAEALRSLARAAGGVLLSQPDGSLVARPFNGAHLGAVSVMEARLVREAPGASGIEMRTHAVSDGIEVDGDGTARTVRVTPQPWRNVSMRIAGGGVTMTTPTVAIHEIADEVQPITAGIGAATHPVSRIVSARFSDGINRALHFRRGEPGIWLDTPTDTVVTLKYQTRAIESAIETTTRQPVNIIIEDSTL